VGGDVAGLPVLAAVQLGGGRTPYVLAVKVLKARAPCGTKNIIFALAVAVTWPWPLRIASH